MFLSYARIDQAAIRPLARSLRERGLRVFVDETAVDDFDSISQVIRRELSRAATLIAFYSRSYLGRRACQWELTAAYLAGQREGAAHRRVLVVNPERTGDHIHPVELRDARHWSELSVESLPVFADKVAAHVASLAGPIGQVGALKPVRWLPAPPRLGPPEFTGRLPHLWRLHSELRPDAAPLLTGRTAPSAVVVRGGPQTGKTLLAEEYAVRFSATFPGGVYWLDLDNDPAPVALYTRRVRTVCSALDLPATGSLDELLSTLAVDLGRHGLPCLWVVDGLPPGLPPDQVRMFLAPHAHAATILTTRGRYPRLATPIDLDDEDLTGGGLDDGDPVDWDTGHREHHGQRRPASTGAERAAAFDLQVELTTRIGVQPLADGAGSPREALTSLYAIFGATRAILRRYGPEAAVVYAIANDVLNRILRPFLTRWHSELATHEERRVGGTGAWAHERSWPAAAEFRAELARLREPLCQAVARLAKVSGTGPDHEGDPAGRQVTLG